MSNPIRRAVGSYKGAAGLVAAVRETDPDKNADRFTIRHVETGLRLLVEPDGRDAYVQGGRCDATGFETERLAKKAGERFSLEWQGFVIEQPTK